MFYNEEQPNDQAQQGPGPAPRGPCGRLAPNYGSQHASGRSSPPDPAGTLERPPTVALPSSARSALWRLPTSHPAHAVSLQVPTQVPREPSDRLPDKAACADGPASVPRVSCWGSKLSFSEKNLLLISNLNLPWQGLITTTIREQMFY